MQAERVETGWATVWILALVAEVAMLMFLAANLRAAQPVPHGCSGYSIDQ